MDLFSTSIDTNPLLEGFEIEIDRAEWWSRLSRDPFKGVEIEQLTPTRRDLLIDTFTDTYVPTQMTAEIAYQIHRMLIGGWMRRNPREQAARQALYQLAHSANQGLINVPCFSTSTRGILIKGVTKQGKSRLLESVLRQYPQVIRRGADPESGWLALDQLVYLVIPMPSDASKGGFLMSAFIELDKVLGTSYAKDTRIMNSSIDIQLVQFLAKLALHRCGLLIIEEAQDTNELANNKFGRDFNGFFLRVLNTGIPTIIVGNPKAFDNLETNAQLMSRLSDPGQYELRPSETPTSPEWANDLVPGIWGKNLLPEPDEPIEELNKFLWQATKGFVHYLSLLRRETLRAAIDAGSRFVQRVHIDAAMKTPVMQQGMSIVESYWRGRAGGEVGFTDIPGVPDLSVIQAKNKRRRKPGKSQGDAAAK